MSELYINELTKEFCEIISKNLKNELTFCEKTDKKTFVAKFIGLKYPLLVFEVSSGRIIMNNAEDIVLMRKYESATRGV